LIMGRQGVVRIAAEGLRRDNQDGSAASHPDCRATKVERWGRFRRLKTCRPVITPSRLGL
jgi:hypothetical protein